MSIEISMVNSIKDLDKYVDGSVYEVKKLQHELRFFHPKDVPLLGANEKTFGPFLSEAVDKGTKEMQRRLKPQHKKAPLWIGIFTGPNMPDDMIIRVGVRSIMKGLATPEELFTPESLEGKWY